MATLVRSQRRKFPARLFKELAAPWDEVGPFLALILRIAILVHRSRALTHSPPMSIRIDRHTIFLKFPLGWLEDHPLTNADLELEVGYLAAENIHLTYL